MKINRRAFTLTGGAFTLAFLSGNDIVTLSPSEAKAHNIPFQKITAKQARLIDILGDGIVPGANESGLTHYIDHQLSSTTEDNLMILRYLRVSPPFDGFYNSALTAFEGAIKKHFGKSPEQLTKAEVTEFIPLMMRQNPDGWSESDKNAPPAPFFYFVLRSDAIDVTYGSMEQFDSLDIPYMAHIEPNHRWEIAK